MKLLRLILTALITTPIWFYLIYQILVRVEASELMWFLFYVYVPATFTVAVISIYLLKEEA